MVDNNSSRLYLLHQRRHADFFRQTTGTTCNSAAYTACTTRASFLLLQLLIHLLFEAVLVCFCQGDLYLRDHAISFQPHRQASGDWSSRGFSCVASSPCRLPNVWGGYVLFVSRLFHAVRQRPPLKAWVEPQRGTLESIRYPNRRHFPPSTSTRSSISLFNRQQSNDNIFLFAEKQGVGRKRTTTRLVIGNFQFSPLLRLLSLRLLLDFFVVVVQSWQWMTILRDPAPLFFPRVVWILSEARSRWARADRCFSVPTCITNMM